MPSITDSKKWCLDSPWTSNGELSSTTLFDVVNHVFQVNKTLTPMTHLMISQRQGSDMKYVTMLCLLPSSDFHRSSKPLQWIDKSEVCQQWRYQAGTNLPISILLPKSTCTYAYMLDNDCCSGTLNAVVIVVECSTTKLRSSLQLLPRRCLLDPWWCWRLDNHSHSRAVQ